MFAVVNYWDFEIFVASLLKEIWLIERYYARGFIFVISIQQKYYNKLF